MVPVVGVDQEVNLTAVLLPLNPKLTVFYWWIGHSLQVRRPPGWPLLRAGGWGRRTRGMTAELTRAQPGLSPGAAERVRPCLHLAAAEEGRLAPAFSWGKRCEQSR